MLIAAKLIGLYNDLSLSHGKRFRIRFRLRSTKYKQSKYGLLVKQR